MMKRFILYIVISTLAAAISACGAPPVPTVSAADVQHTAEAAAFTMVAQTQAVLPTETLLPPTEIPTQTPLPTDTPIALPSLQATLTTVSGGTVAGNATVDPCSTRVISGSPKGKSTVIHIINKTKAPVTVSVFLNETAGQGECGYRSYNLGKLNDVTITDLVQGCYNLWAWGDAPKVHVNGGGYGCINNDDKWTFEVNTGSIKFIGP